MLKRWSKLFMASQLKPLNWTINPKSYRRGKYVLITMSGFERAYLFIDNRSLM